MRTLSLSYSPLILASLITVASFTPSFADKVEVVDPTTGETVALGDIDRASLSEDDRKDIGDQLAERGIEAGRHGGRGGEGHGSEDHDGEGHGDEGHDGESHGDEGRDGEGHGDEGRDGEGHGGEGHGGEGGQRD